MCCSICLSYIHALPPLFHRTKKAHKIAKSNVLSFYFVSVLIKHVHRLSFYIRYSLLVWSIKFSKFGKETQVLFTLNTFNFKFCPIIDKDESFSIFALIS